jgi:hypothetical protein
MSAFAETMNRMAVLTDEQMARPWHWRPDGEEDLQVRDAFHRSLEDENVQTTSVMTAGLGEVAAALSLAQRAAGDLCGLLAGQADELFDREPAPGEWPLREVIRHTINTEVGFRARSLWAVDRGPDDSLDVPADRVPADVDVSGDANSITAALLAARADTDAQFARLTADELARPARWAGFAVDVRFRMHRHASHLVEHTNQCEKVSHALGQDPGEARQLVRAIWAARGGHERLSDAAALRALDDELAARVKSFGV